MRVYVRIGASVLGLVAIGCDFILTRRGEAQYIWTKPLRVTVVRCLFILIRYLPIAIHIIGLIFAARGYIGTQPVPEEYCMDILVIEIIASYIMLVLLEVVLMLRVFALYDRSRTIGIFLVAVLVSRIAGSVYTIEERVLKFQAVKITFPGYCVARFSFKHPLGNPVVVFIYSAMTVQLLTLALALKRTMWDLRQYSHSLFSILNRDGLIVFGAIGVAMIAIGVGTVKQGVPNVFILPLFISLVSAAGCHSILNLQKLESASVNSSERKKDLEFSTIENVNIVMWEAPWDARTFQIIESGTITRPEEGEGPRDVETVDRV
ncbi:hypothetical protein BDP27DRAFT_1405910 [Rhodocollybia butyracea]|uniref:DUF6533 domain-containing protein n=1 Tax=Rhodocollybia butyracea TaxID=206335 RepID=A0A9P5U118_9AGAR|nr:hypothetical protein BDP27DRAFT_1405910 [Rhodocollybia butyracea]